MARKNPLRGHYMVVGTDVIRAGIVDGVFIRESGRTAIISADPASERWLTSRAVSAACAKAGLPVDLNAVALKSIVAYLRLDPRAVQRFTEDAIVAISGGESAEARAFAKAELAKLDATYGVTAATAAA